MRTKRFRWSQVALLAAVFAIVLGQLLRLGAYPGLYFDSVFPDYAALQVLFPQQRQSMWQVAWPWLCQLYHGNVGVVLTMISVLITGTTGVVQHHLVYGLLAAACVCLLWGVLTHPMVGVGRRAAAVTALALAAWPSLLTIVITQYYMCLFGTACLLWAALLLLDWAADRTHRGRLWAGWFLLGLAFYSYFNFLFFLPAALLFTLHHLKKDALPWFDRLMPALLAYLAGCGFYVIGYTQIALNVVVATGIPARLGLLAAFTLMVGTMFIAFVKKWRFRLPMLGICAAAAVGWAFWVLPAVSAELHSLQVLGSAPASLWDRLVKIASDYAGILSGNNAEQMIYGHQVSGLPARLDLAAALLALCTFVLERVSGRHDRRWKLAGLTMVLFFGCCVLFGSRMQTQHYVPLLFVTAALVCLCLSSAAQSVKKLLGRRYPERPARVVCAALAVLLVGAALTGQTRVLREIRATGGEGKWAAEMTDLAQEALSRHAAGVSEAYLFCDWGFYAGFDYLTMNRIPFMTEIRPDELAGLYRDGVTLVACYWDASDEARYRSLYETVGLGGGRVAVTARTDDHGRIEFYEITLTPDGEGADGDAT